MKLYKQAEVEQFKRRENEFWIYSYADVITNLMAFFIMLIVMMQMKPTAFEKVKETLAKATGGRYQVPDQELANAITALLKEQHLDNNVAIEATPEGLAMTFEGGLFFDSGQAELRPEAVDLIKKLSLIIKKTPKKFAIDVEGHTDNRPVVGSLVYPSNWELSSARAGTVIRALQSEGGLQGKHFRALGLADTKPVAPNFVNGKESPENQEKNRRVVIRLSAR